MVYQVLLTTDETGELYEFDNNSRDNIKESLIIPYLRNEEFQFNGYFIVPSKVKRLIVTETQKLSNIYVKKAYANLPSNVFMSICPEECVFSAENSKDITKSILQEAKDVIEESGKSNIKKSANEITKEPPTTNRTIFLGYSYRKIDDEFVLGFKELLTDKGFDVIDGKADGLGSISQAIIEKITISDIVVIVMTKRDKKENGKFTTSAWLLEEKGAALALKK